MRNSRSGISKQHYPAMTVSGICPTSEDFKNASEPHRERMKNSLRWHAAALEQNPARRLELLRHVDEFAEQAISSSATPGRELVEVE